MKHLPLTTIATVLLVELVSTRPKADEALKYWPQWRGPSWNGVALQADPPITWSETENLLWKTPIEGSGCARPRLLGLGLGRYPVIVGR